MNMTASNAFPLSDADTFVSIWLKSKQVLLHFVLMHLLKHSKSPLTLLISVCTFAIADAVKTHTECQCVGIDVVLNFSSQQPKDSEETVQHSFTTQITIVPTWTVCNEIVVHELKIYCFFKHRIFHYGNFTKEVWVCLFVGVTRHSGKHLSTIRSEKIEKTS